MTDGEPIDGVGAIDINGENGAPALYVIRPPRDRYLYRPGSAHLVQEVKLRRLRRRAGDAQVGDAQDHPGHSELARRRHIGETHIGVQFDERFLPAVEQPPLGVAADSNGAPRRHPSDIGWQQGRGAAGSGRIGAN
jgi:hypothetical protein